MCFVIVDDAVISLSYQKDIFLRWSDTFANDCIMLMHLMTMNMLDWRKQNYLKVETDCNKRLIVESWFINSKLNVNKQK